MLTPLLGLSLEPPASEVDFLRRELGITWYEVEEDELRSRVALQQRTLVIVSEPAAYAPLFERAPDNSIVCLMISDEAYALDRLDLARLPAVHRVYRHYPAQPAALNAIVGSALGYVRDARGTSQRARTVLPNLVTGWQVRWRMRNWQTVQHKLHAVPLGYTDTFATAFAQRFELPADTSLFNVEVDKFSQRAHSITFRGNRGLAQRIVGCERAGVIADSDVDLIEADWSARSTADTGDRYVDSLVSARFALCPPGFANNESFRFYEALVCGALPIEVAIASTHLGLLAWRTGGTIVAPSWRRSLAIAADMTEGERQRRLHEARTLVMQALHDAAVRIRMDLENR